MRHIAQTIAEISAQASRQMSEQLTPFLEDFQRFTIKPWLKKLEPVFQQLAGMARDSMPPNWDATDLGMKALLRRGELIQSEGLPLVWVPRAQLVTSLETELSPEDRLRHLHNNAARILADCHESLADVKEPRVHFLAESIEEAVTSAELGNSRAAQALATAALDTGYTRLLNLTSSDARRRFIRDLRSETLGWIRFSLAMAPLPVALKNFKRGGVPPERYNRHATFHAVTPEQYSETNALLACMLATSCIREWDHFLATGRTLPT